MEESTKRRCGDVLLIPKTASGHMNPMMSTCRELMNRGLTVTMPLPEDKLSVMDSHVDVRDNENFQLVLLPNRGGAGGQDGGRHEGRDGDREGFRDGGRVGGEDGGRHGGRDGGRHGGRDEGRHGGRGPNEGGRGPNEGRKDPNEGGRGPRKGGRGGGHNIFEEVCEPFLNRVLAEKQAGGEGPRCLIADQLDSWAMSWAPKLQIPGFLSLASPATYGYAGYNLSANLASGLRERDEEDQILDLPGIPPLRLGDLPDSLRLMLSLGESFVGAEGILINTFYELEAPAIDAFIAEIQSKGLKAPKILPMGPMVPSEFFAEGLYRGVNTDSECIKWLDARPPASVVYIAFGSMEELSPSEILELAKALEETQESFLWVLRSEDKNVDVFSLLPPGFQERTKDIGLLFPGFAPQLQILSHPATGGFISHCGWNSSLESICRGVPIIAWPQGAEQKLCCRVLVDQAKVATETRPRLDGKHEFVTSSEIASALKVLMRQKEGQELKKRAVELQSLARAAVAPGGSSMESYKQFVEIIRRQPTRIV